MPPVPITPDEFPKTIYGIHDLEGANFLAQNQCSGWILHTVKVDTDQPPDYSQYTSQNLRVIVRLNNDYGSGGTIPTPDQYDAFAQRCADWVAASHGAQIWIIGNETNLSGERPNGQPILPTQYATCYIKCRNAIHGKAGHANDQVIPASVGPWNTETTYAGNTGGDWIKYFQDMLAAIKAQGGSIDAIGVHTYTHGTAPALITDESKFNAPYQNNHFNFRTYRDFMNAIPTELRGVPVYITETQTVTNNGPEWTHQNTGWVQAAYSEINAWNLNAANQPIQALVLFRWKADGNPQWAIENFPEIQNDSRAAIAQNYQLVMPHTAVTPPPGSLQEAVKDRAVAAKPWMPVNHFAALWKFAKANGLEDQQTDELSLTFNSEQYLVQVFNLGIVYVKVGDWGNIKLIRK